MHQRGQQALFFGNYFGPPGADHPVNDKKDPACNDGANCNGIHGEANVRVKLVDKLAENLPLLVLLI